MKVGDLVKLNDLHPEWGKVGLITRVNVTGIANMSQVYLLAGGTSRTIPWLQKDKYMKVINEAW